MYIYGKNVAESAILAKEKIKTAYLQKNFKDKTIIDNLNCPIVYLEKYELDKKIAGNHQGIILEVNDYEYTSIDNFYNYEFVVIMDHLEDPHNFGAIIRTSEAAGVNGIIIPKDRSVEVNSTVIKVSAGTIANVPIAKVTNIVNTINDLKKHGFWVIGTDMFGTDYSSIDYKGKIAIAIGNEGNGMSRLVKESCDFIASINMNGQVNSLNASVATGIVLFEAVKQRR